MTKNSTLPHKGCIDGVSGEVVKSPKKEKEDLGLHDGEPSSVKGTTTTAKKKNV